MAIPSRKKVLKCSGSLNSAGIFEFNCRINGDTIELDGAFEFLRMTALVAVQSREGKLH